MKEFSLVLSGGAALGFAHLGVIRYLEENNLKPKEIIGTSMGGLIGATYALGLNYHEIYDIIEEINFFKLAIPSFSKQSLLSLENIKRVLKKSFKSLKIKDLKINLKIVSTDINTGEIRIFDKKSNAKIVDILCATIAIPGIFPPQKIGGRLLVDGFLSSNLPIEICNNKSNKILAINVMNNTNLNHNKNSSNLIKAVTKITLILILNQNKPKVEDKNYKDSLILIEPDLSNYSTSSFKNWKEIIKKGYTSIKESKHTPCKVLR